MAEANAGKALTVEVEGAKYSRIPIRTRVVMPGDDLDAFIREYATDVVAPGDIFFVTEKIVAITQGRSYLVEDITPRRLALFLSKFVVRTPYGIGGDAYMFAALLLGGAFFGVGAWGLRHTAGRRWARTLFLSSIVYLTGLFAALTLGG